MEKRPNLTLLAGEMSGDNVGAMLARALRERQPDLHLWGMGSRRMANAQVELLYDSAEWSAIGVIEALRVYPRLRFTVYPHLLREIERRRPAVVILIDFGAFNVKVARWCKARGVKVLYYFPPGSWKRRGRLNPEIAQIADRIATPFPWSAQRLAEIGAKVEFVGHPLLEIVRPTLTRAQFAERFGMEPGKPIIGLLPGSRRFEVEYNTPAMLGAAQRITQEMPEAQFVFGVASEAARQRIEACLERQQQELADSLSLRREPDALKAEAQREGPRNARWKMVTPEGVTVSSEEMNRRFALRRRLLEQAGQYTLPPVVLAENLTYDVMAHSDALIICSGTATLEAAILGTPMVILYRGSKLMEVEYRLRRIHRIEHIGMPNILAGERIVPEFIQQQASPEALAEATLRLLRDPQTRARAREALLQVRTLLGTPGASARTAQIALELAGLTK